METRTPSNVSIKTICLKCTIVVLRVGPGTPDCQASYSQKQGNKPAIYVSTPAVYAHPHEHAYRMRDRLPWFALRQSLVIVLGRPIARLVGFVRLFFDQLGIKSPLPTKSHSMPTTDPRPQVIPRIIHQAFHNGQQPGNNTCRPTGRRRDRGQALDGGVVE